MQRLISVDEYCKLNGIHAVTLWRWEKDGKIFCVKQGKEKFVIENKAEVTSDPDVKRMLIDSKVEEFKNTIKQIALMRNHDNKQATAKIREILDEVKRQAGLGIEIKGFTQRSIQRKIARVLDGDMTLNRITREDIYRPRVKILKEKPEVLEKAIKLVSDIYKLDPLTSLRNAIDRVRMAAEKDEALWEIRALNYHTLYRHINNAFIQSGMDDLVQFLNHYNLFRVRLPYVHRAFTHDIGFRDVYSLDDHKFDVAGVKVWDESKREFVQKQIHSWFMVDVHTMQPLAYKIQCEPFKGDDIIDMIALGLMEHGLPKKKIICDQGLAADTGVKNFCTKLGVILDPQPAYTPTAKAPNERFYKLVKEEIDIYNPNFVGSNHPTEGKHPGLKLSPEETTELMSERLKLYDDYIQGFLMDRPRSFAMPGVDHLRDETKRVSIRKVTEYFMQSHTKIAVNTAQLKYAYMKNDEVKFEKMYLMFKGLLYIPKQIMYSFHNASNRFTVAYNPHNLSEIDLYAAHYMRDTVTGEEVEAGKKVCALECISTLEAAEKSSKVAIYRKKVLKAKRDLAEALNAEGSFEKDLIGVDVDEAGRIRDMHKERVKDLMNTIDEELPPEKIEVVLKKSARTVNMDEALSDKSIDALNDLKI